MASVTIINDSGDRLEDIRVDLRDDTGRVVDSEITDRGIVRFCDFGFGRHELLVRPPSCEFEVRLSGIEVDFGFEQDFTVVVPDCSHVMATGCPVHIRVTDSTGTGVPYATVRLRSESVQTDSLGRLKTGIKLGSTWPVVASTEDGHAAAIIACAKLRRINLELELGAIGDAREAGKKGDIHDR